MSLETKSNDSAGTGAPVGMSLQAYIEQLKRENQSLSARLLGVNELARLLQEKTEACANHVEKNKRQEIAIIRLENRCSNLDKKLRQMSSSGGGTGGTPAQVRTSQSPFIPGPSRQILETLMKENSELKKTINKLHKKGETGYIEAVVCWPILFFCFTVTQLLAHLAYDIAHCVVTGLTTDLARLTCL